MWFWTCSTPAQRWERKRDELRCWAMEVHFKPQANNPHCVYCGNKMTFVVADRFIKVVGYNQFACEDCGWEVVLPETEGGMAGANAPT